MRHSQNRPLQIYIIYRYLTKCADTSDFGETCQRSGQASEFISNAADRCAFSYAKL